MRNIKKPGIASVPTVIVLMALILSVGVVISSLSISDNLSVSESNLSGKALNYAQLGAKDALEKITINKDYASSYLLNVVSGGCTTPYPGCVSVTVSSSSPKIINAEGWAYDTKRKIQVDVNLDANGLITGYSWKEL